MKAVKIIKKICGWILTAALSLIIIFLAFVFVTEHLGTKVPTIGPYQMYVVKSDSMVPTFRAGDLIVIKNTAAQNLKVNDIITFAASDTSDMLVTHRIIGMENNGNSIEYTTKGDSNAAQDLNSASSGAVKGKYVFRIPRIGYYFVFLQTYPLVPISAFTAIGLIFGIRMIFLAFRDKKKLPADVKYIKSET